MWCDLIRLFHFNRSSLILLFVVLHHIFKHFFFTLVGALFVCKFIDFLIGHWLWFIFRGWLTSSFSNRGSKCSSRSSDVVGCSSSFSSNSLSLPVWHSAADSSTNHDYYDECCSTNDSLRLSNFYSTYSD